VTDGSLRIDVTDGAAAEDADRVDEATNRVSDATKR